MKLKGLKIKITKSEYLSFFLTLLATLIGVWIANSLSDYSVVKREKESAIKMILSTKQLVESTFKLSKGLGKSMEYLANDSTLSEKDLESMKKNNPLPYPEYVNTTIANPAVLNHISSFTYESMYKQLINLEKLVSYERLDYYLEELENTRALLQTELNYLKEDLDLDQLEESYEEEKEKIHLKYEPNEYKVIPEK